MIEDQDVTAVFGHRSPIATHATRVLRRAIPAPVNVADIGEIFRVGVSEGAGEPEGVAFFDANLQGMVSRIAVVRAKRDVADQRVQREEGAAWPLRTGSRERLIDVDVADQVIAASTDVRDVHEQI